MKWVLGLLLVTTLGASAAGLHEHTLKSYPKPRGQSCQAVAQSLAERFLSITKVDLYWAGARKESPTTCDVTISYVAPSAVTIASSVDRESLVADPAKGAYRSMPDCLAALTFETDFFERQTGLTAWTAYCYDEARFMGAFNFVPVVEGIGTPARALFKPRTLVLERPTKGWAALLDSVNEGARRNGLALVTAHAEPSIADHELVLRFYAKQRLWVRTEGYAQSDTPRLCEQQLRRAADFLQSATTPPLAVYCSRKWERDYRLSLVTLSTEVLGPTDLAVSTDPKIHATEDACLAAVGETERFYRETLKRPVLGGVCGGSGSVFQVTLFEKKAATP